ncbi:MAG: TerB family tellurite resistance protein [Gammaproteobacteria bacterium]|nr:TerB family tellurite resistance protein [Gammaproteobacteria bacterium]
MLRRLRRFMESAQGPSGQPDPAARVRLAVAALLVEIARADHEEKAVEHAAITGLIARHFQLDTAAAEELLVEARTVVDDAVSLRQFTAPLHEALSYDDKLGVVAMLWNVALEDNSLDKYEDYLISKVAELLYVSRGDVVRLRYEAGQRRGG